MRSGTDYHENGPDSPHYQMKRLTGGWDKFYLDRPMLRPPGTGFLYDSGGVILMSAMLKNRTGMHADGYAERYLFKPLGIEKKFWIKNPEGHAHTGGGLFSDRPGRRQIRAALPEQRPVGGRRRSCPRTGSGNPSGCTST